MKLMYLLIMMLVLSKANTFADDTTTEKLQKALINTSSFNGTVAWLDQPANSKSRATLIGIHGTPGSWDAWQALMAESSIQQVYNFIAVDRPGWGASQSNDQRAWPKLSDQAEVIAHTLRHIEPTAPVILVAHSWGGPVALTLAAQYPELVDGLVLIATPANAKISKPRWYHRAAKLKPVQWIIGKQMSRSNIEMLTLDQELTLLSAFLADIRQPVAIMQGKKDFLVEPENAFYLQRQLSKASVNLYYDLDGNHFIPFSKTDDVVEAIRWVTEAI